MIGWIARIVMSLAAVITGWFISAEAANFGVIQMVVGMLLFVFFVAAAAFGPMVLRLFTRRRDTNPSGKS